jgi:hypothetical protein
MRAALAAGLIAGMALLVAGSARAAAITETYTFPSPLVGYSSSPPGETGASFSEFNPALVVQIIRRSPAGMQDFLFEPKPRGIGCQICSTRVNAGQARAAPRLLTDGAGPAAALDTRRDPLRRTL